MEYVKNVELAYNGEDVADVENVDNFNNFHVVKSVENLVSVKTLKMSQMFKTATRSRVQLNAKKILRGAPGAGSRGGRLWGILDGKFRAWQCADIICVDVLRSLWPPVVGHVPPGTMRCRQLGIDANV